MTTITLDKAVDTLLEVIKTDYLSWSTRSATARGLPELDNVSIDMIEKFCEGLYVKTGKKYLKVMTQNSVWGFVVVVDTDKKFKKGDILKPAGFNAPARNAARGNIFDESYNVNWTGPQYLK